VFVSEDRRRKDRDGRERWWKGPLSIVWNNNKKP